MRTGPTPLTTVPRPPKNGEQEVMKPMQWRDVTVGGQDTTGLSLKLPVRRDKPARRRRWKSSTPKG